MKFYKNKSWTIFAIVFLLLSPVLTVFAVDESPSLETGADLSVNAPVKPNEATADAGSSNELSLLGLIDKGGVVGYLIIIISVLALGLVIDYLFTIRRSRILPERDLAILKNLIEERELDKVNDLETDGSSFVLRVTVAGLREAHLGYDTMIRAMEDTSEALASAIARKTEHLNVIGSISPMLGLLGTVIGMLQVFNEIAITPGAIEPRQLAEGIFQALVTTCLGLIVAIPALYSYAIFRNRVDEFTGEAALAAEHLVSSFKQPRA